MSSQIPIETLLADADWVRNLTRRLSGDAHRAADLEQDLAVAMLSQPHDAALGRSWIAAIARNLAAAFHRRHSVEQRHLRAQYLRGPSPRTPVPSAAELVATAELQQRAVAAVLALPAPYRDTVLLRFLEGLSIAQTAAAMRVPEETVRTRQKRALAMLREQLEPRKSLRAFALFGLAPSAVTGVVVNAKHGFVAVAVLMLCLAITSPLWSPPSAVAPIAGTGSAARVSTPLAEGSDGADRRPEVDVVRQEAPIAAATPAATPASGTLAVEVHWADDGTIAADLAVHCHRLGSLGWFARTDASGVAQFVDLAPGSYEVSSPRYDNRRVEVTPGEIGHLRLDVPRGLLVQGVVMDADGAVVPGAEIVGAMAGVAPQWTFLLGRSDFAGAFRIPGAAGGMLLSARHSSQGVSSCLLLTDQQHGGAKPEPVVLTLSRAFVELSGQVVDSEGHAVTGAWVQVRGTSYQLSPDADGRLWRERLDSLCSTDAKGSFRLPLQPAGRMTLFVYQCGFAPWREVVTLEPAVARQMIVVLERGGTLTGVVRAENGDPLAGVEVSYSGFDHPAPDSTTTDEHGRYTLVDVPRGAIGFTAELRSRGRQQRTITFAGDEQQMWDVEMPHGLRIVGRLVDDAGAPLGKWAIMIVGHDRYYTSDDEGRFVVPDCAESDNQLIVRRSPGFVPEVMRFEEVLPGETARDFVVPKLRHASARVRGVFATADGIPLGEVGIDLEQNDHFVLLDNQQSRADLDGGFDLGPFPPGRYLIQPTQKDFAFEPIEIELQPDEVRELGVVRAKSPARRR